MSVCFLPIAGAIYSWNLLPGENSWCGRGDLNPHAFRRHPLKMVCLPVPPLPHECETELRDSADYSKIGRHACPAGPEIERIPRTPPVDRQTKRPVGRLAFHFQKLAWTQSPDGSNISSGPG